MNTNPIKYDDLFAADLNSKIEETIKKIEGINDALDEVKKAASSKKMDIAGASGATEEGRRLIAETEKETQKLIKAENELQFARSEANKKLIELNIQKKEAQKLAELEVRINSSVEGSYNRLSAQYDKNKIALNKMSETQRTTTEEGRKLVAETEAIYASMQRLQEATGKHTLSVGNYAKGWNGLNAQINMLVREIPNLSMGFNMFFLSLSNNLPMFFDELQRARIAAEELKKSGENVTPVWKQVISGFMSWQTLLVVGVALLTKYGAQMIEFIGSLFGASKTMKEMRAELEKTTQSWISERLQIDLLFDSLRKTTQGTQEYNTIKEEIISRYGKYLEGLTAEKAALDDIEGAYKAITLAAAESARVKALTAVTQKATEEAAKSIEENLLRLRTRLIDAFGEETGRQYFITIRQQLKEGAGVLSEEMKKIVDSLTIIQGPVGTAQQSTVSNRAKQAVEEIITTRKELEDNIKQSEQTIKDLYQTVGFVPNVIKSLIKEQEKLLEQAKLMPEATEKEITAKNIRIKQIDDEINRLKNLGIETQKSANSQAGSNKKIADSATALREAQIAGIKEETERQVAESKLKTELKIKEIQDRGNLTQTEIELIKQLEQNGQDEILKILSDGSKKIQQLELDNQLKSLQSQKKGLEVKLNGVRQGSLEEIDLRLKLMETQRQIELAQNAKLAVESQRDVAEINAEWDAAIFKERSDRMNAYFLKEFDMRQELAQSEFDLLKTTEGEKTRFMLQAERDRLQKILELNKTAAVQMTDDEVKTIQNRIKKYDEEIKGTKTSPKSFYEMLGFDLEKDKELIGRIENVKSAVSEATQYVIQQFEAILDAKVRTAEQALEVANKEVDTARSKVEKEIEARNAGYASNVITAQKELDNAKKNQDKANREHEKAVKAQQKLDSIQQTSSLITAAAGIMKGFSSIPYVGIALGVAAVAAMFAAFMAAKSQAASASTETYGEGTVELLQGGSHASGNDVDLGTKRDGTRRRAEGGEYFAVVRKDMSRKYRKIVPDVIDAFNRGVFEQKYLNAYNTDGLSLIVNSRENKENLDLQNIEGRMDEILDQIKNQKQYILTPDGKLIMKYKNLTRIYK